MALRLTELGVGVVWWPPLDAVCREVEGLVDVIEVEPEAYWIPNLGGSGFRSFLPFALRHLSQPKLLHGVGAPLAGTCPAPNGHTAALIADVVALRPEHVSEHLSFTRVQPSSGLSSVFVGFMLPPLQSAAGVAAAAANIRRYREAIGGIQLAVETPVSYLPPAPGEWPDGTFVAAVAEAADCGIVLDLHNVLCNARNGRQSVEDFCSALPLERVWELHLAGGEWESGFYLDAHSGLIDPRLMEIATTLVPTLPHLRAIIFEIMPERVAEVGLSAISRQLGQIKDLWSTRAKGRGCQAKKTADFRPSAEPPIDAAAWNTLLGSAVTGCAVPGLNAELNAWWHSALPAFGLYRSLVSEGRASAVATAAPRTTRVLLQQLGAGTRQLLAGFWRHSPQGYTAADEAAAFLEFLCGTGAIIPGLAEAVAEDSAELTMAAAQLSHTAS
jgi:uncharacterized protein (UPF0276 family)